MDLKHHFVDYLLRIKVPSPELAGFLGKILAQESQPTLQLGNVASGAFYGFSLDNRQVADDREWKSSLRVRGNPTPRPFRQYVNPFEQGKVSDGNPGWTPVDTELVAVTFSSEAFSFRNGEISFDEGVFSIHGLTDAAAHTDVPEGTYDRPLTLRMDSAGEGIYGGRVELHHHPLSTQQALEAHELQQASRATVTAS
jgi:hypothetical protein